MPRQHVKRVFSLPTANRLADTPVSNEVIRDSDRNRLFSGDGTTAGGLIIADDIRFESSTPTTTLEHGDVVYVDTTGAAFAVTLPAAAPDGTWVWIVDAGDNCGTNTLTINADTTIDGTASSYAFNINGAFARFVKRAAVWAVDQQRVVTFADVVAGYFPAAFGSIGQGVRVATSATTFEYYTPPPDPPTDNGVYTLTVSGGVSTWTKGVIHQTVTLATLAANTPTVVTPALLAGGVITGYTIVDTGSNEFRQGTLSEIEVPGTPALQIESVTALTALKFEFTGVPG